MKNPRVEVERLERAVLNGLELKRDAQTVTIALGRIVSDRTKELERDQRDLAKAKKALAESGEEE